MTKSYLIISVFIVSILSCQENRKIKHSGFDDLVVGSETINLFQNGEFSIEVGTGYQEGTYIIKGDTVHLAYNQKVNLPQKFILDDDQFKSIDFSREITISRTDRSQIESIPKKNIKVFDLKNEFKIKEIIKSNDYPSCEKDTTMCNDWILTKQDIKLIIKNAQPINGPEWHHLFNHFPCRIHGKLVQGANEYEYSINSGAWFTVNSIDTTLMFGSFKEENKKFFLSTALTEDERELKE